MREIFPNAEQVRLIPILPIPDIPAPIGPSGIDMRRLMMSQKNIPDSFRSTKKSLTISKITTMVMVKIVRSTVNALKNASDSFPSLIRLMAAPPKPPSVTVLNIPRYAWKRKYAPRIDAPTVLEK